MLKRILITGANAGLGKECARQLALLNGTEKIYLGCRNEKKAKSAKKELEKSTGKSVFEILLIDVSNLASVRTAVLSLKEPIDALVMNAGGGGDTNFNDKTEDGVTQQFAVNVLGHVVLAEELLKAKKLTKVALYAGSEAARGVEAFGIKQPDLKTSSVDEFMSICNGNFFGEVTDAMIPFGSIKYMAALWISSLARKYPDVRLITMSPGGTTGTEASNTLPPLRRFMMTSLMKIMVLFGKAHKLEVGAKRFVDGLQDESYKSGVFYASKSGVTGPIVDQETIFENLNNRTYQDNTYEAIHRFIK